MSGQSVEAYCADLIATLEPSARLALAREIATKLKASQQKRIAAQLNPDGSAYEPRKPQLRHQKGKIRRQMFNKLRTGRFIKSKSTADGAIIHFTRDVERIARVHQLGLRDIVNRKTGAEADYPERRLLGISDADEALIAEIVTAHLAERL